MIDGDVERDDRDFFRLKIHRFNTFSAKKARLPIFKKPKSFCYATTLVTYEQFSIQNVLFSNKNGRHLAKKGD